MMKLMHTPKDMARELAQKYEIKMSQETTSCLADLLVPEQYRHRTTIINLEEKCDKMYFILKGLMIISTPTSAENRVDAILREGETLVCSECLFKDEASKYIVKTLEPTVVYTISYEYLRQFAAESAEVHQLLCAIYEQEILKQEQRFNLLSLNSKDRYLAFMNTEGEKLRRTQLKYIASYLRMAPETLSRIRNILSRK